MLRLAKVEKKQIAKAYYDLDAEVMEMCIRDRPETVGSGAEQPAAFAAEEKYYGRSYQGI